MKIDFPFMGRMIFFVREPPGDDDSGWFLHVVTPTDLTVEMDTPTFRVDGRTYELELDPQFAVCEIRGGRCFNPSTGREFESLDAAEKYFIPRLLQRRSQASPTTGVSMGGNGTVTPPSSST